MDEERNARLQALAVSISPAYNAEELRYIARVLEKIALKYDVAEEDERERLAEQAVETDA